MWVMRIELSHDLWKSIEWTWTNQCIDVLVLLGENNHLESVAADGLITGTRIEPMVQRRSRRHQQAAHFGAVAFKHTNTLPTLQRQRHTRLIRSDTEMGRDPAEAPLSFVDTHRQVEGLDGAVSWAGVQDAVVDVHGVHRLLVTLERTLSGQLVLSAVGRHVWEVRNAQEKATLARRQREDRFLNEDSIQNVCWMLKRLKVILDLIDVWSDACLVPSDAGLSIIVESQR